MITYQMSRRSLIEPRRAWLERSYLRQRGRCYYCGWLLYMPGRRRSYEPGVRRATVDHIIALSKGGPESEDNTVACCGPCNNAKGDMDVADFIQLIEAKGLRYREIIQ